MLDQYHRNIQYLRISVTDRCNLRCIYCMPDQGVEWVAHHEILSYEQIVRLAEQFAALGITHIRLTGGEPLVRPHLHRLVSGLRAVSGIERISLTTNGVLLADQLPKLLDAGLDGVNLSLDTLDPKEYISMTRRDHLADALKGLEAALAAPGLTVKLNCVLMERNRSQLVPLASLARTRNLSVRFIEMMPIGLGRTLKSCTQEDAQSLLTAAFGTPLPCDPPPGAGPSQYMTFSNFTGKIGFISAISHKFCSQCNRIRLSAAGHLKTCLQYEPGLNFKPLLEGNADDAQLRDTIAKAISEKPACHHFADGAQEHDEISNMNQIGG